MVTMEEEVVSAIPGLEEKASIKGIAVVKLVKPEVVKPEAAIDFIATTVVKVVKPEAAIETIVVKPEITTLVKPASAAEITAASAVEFTTAPACLLC